MTDGQSRYDETDAAEPIREVTGQRIEELIAEFGFEGEKLQPEAYYCFINSVPIRISWEQLPELVQVTALTQAYELDEACSAELRYFVNEYNARTIYAHATSQRVEETDSQQESHKAGCAATADSPILCGAGLSDQQLKDSLDIAMTACIRFGEQLAAQFELDLTSPPRPAGEHE